MSEASISEAGPLGRKATLQAPEIARLARAQISELTGFVPETVSGVARDGSEWHVSVEAVELRRVPEARDVLATYDVALDADGHLLQYQRVRRYCRGEMAG